jgi:hypothetical protein
MASDEASDICQALEFGLDFGVRKQFGLQLAGFLPPDLGNLSVGW